MNEIFVRSDKGEYLPGDIIYGVVYLNIVTPTAGQGIQLNIKSQEFFCYEYLIGTTRQKVQGLTKHIDSNNVMLYEQEDPFSLGCYKFPFRLQLHNEIPGSFQASGQSAGTGEGREGADQWVAQVQFWLEAIVTNAENIASSHVAHQQLVVNPCRRKELVENTAVEGISVAHPMKRFPLSTSYIHFTFRLLQNYYVTGESAKGRLVITNNTSAKIVGFKLKLVRSLVLMSKQEVSPEFLSSKMRMIHPRVFIQPELQAAAAGEAKQQDDKVVETKTIWETPDALINNQSVCVEDVLDNILIPLNEPNGAPAFPSVKSKQIECEYAVELYLHLSTKEVVELIYPMKGILPERNKQWAGWQPPRWAWSAELLSLPANRSCLVVSHEDLNGEAFAEFPGFQAL